MKLIVTYLVKFLASHRSVTVSISSHIGKYFEVLNSIHISVGVVLIVVVFALK